VRARVIELGGGPLTAIGRAVRNACQVSDILFDAARDRRSLAVQVRDRLLRAIHTEEFPSGAQLPGEHELAERLAVGRSTVREALRLLERDGLIDVVRGRGRYVSALARFRAERPVTEFESVTEMLAGLGYEVRNRVLDVDFQPAGSRWRSVFGIGSRDRVAVLERLRMHKDEVLIYSVNVLDARLAPDELDAPEWQGSIIDLLARRGAQVVSSAATIAAVPLPKTARSLVGDAAGQPWLCITETCVTGDGRAVLHATDFHRGDIFAFHVVRKRTEAPVELPSKRRSKS
jgi:GntR family transcriptional regulator